MREKLKQYNVLTQFSAENEELQEEIDRQILRLEELDKELRQRQQWIDVQLDKIRTRLTHVGNLETRRMIELRFFDNLSWFQVAKRMGAGYSEDMVKKRVERYLKSNKIIKVV